MWAIVRRAVVPSILLAVGLAALIYGAIFHTVPICVEKDREASIAVYSQSNQGEAPAVEIRKTTETYLELREEPEWIVVRETTVGGVTRLANGRLKRTYSGKAPLLCPT